MPFGHSSPWEKNQYAPLSWWEMEKFSAESFIEIGGLLQRLKVEVGILGAGKVALPGNSNTPLSTNQRREISGALKFIAAECRKIALDVSADTVERLREEFVSEPQMPRQAAVGRFSILDTVVQSEMQNQLFLHLPLNQAKRYMSPFLGWEEVVRRFPNTTADIEEAVRCFACDRYAGAVFHAMLVAEFGAIEVGRLVAVGDPKPGWPGTIREMRRIVHGTKHGGQPKPLTPLEHKHRNFLEQLLPLMESVQDGWRHKISHADNRIVFLSGEFSFQVAEEITTATRGFMRRLAMDLPSDESAKP